LPRTSASGKFDASNVIGADLRSNVLRKRGVHRCGFKCFLVDPFASPELELFQELFPSLFSSFQAPLPLSLYHSWNIVSPRGIISDCRIVWDVAILLSRQLENDARSTLHSFISASPSASSVIPFMSSLCLSDNSEMHCRKQRYR